MTNALDYISWRCDIPFAAVGVNEIDAFLFSQLITPHYEGILDTGSKTLSAAADEYFSFHTEDVSNLGVLQSPSVLPMFSALAESRRFGGVILHDYVNTVDESNTEQFSAVSFDLDNGITFVSFRGTDDSIIGWKEDFNIAIMSSVPAQTDAACYLNRILASTDNRIIVCGHSKGGNLAV